MNVNRYIIIARHNYQRFKDKILRKFNQRQLFRNIIRTRYSKRKLNHLLLSVITQILILHLNFLICMIVYVDIFALDFFIHIFISVTLHFFYYHIFHMVSLYRPYFYSCIRYFINEYSEDNFRLWKIKFMSALTIYLLLIISIMKFDKLYLVMSIIENAISFVIIDTIEQRTLFNIIIYNQNIENENDFELLNNLNENYLNLEEN